ncbi:hypothetical protein G4B88_009124 [Cannabis sativa]|uniref:RING-type E3 ubiquitin transferase n=1 Tax=Cannabis sativa TaxID=3483 RepID=A0A7J6HRA5_CANSA|nr:hypothetical protein G4B88_009124 [Cannabis sativa]
MSFLLWRLLLAPVTFSLHYIEHKVDVVSLCQYCNKLYRYLFGARLIYRHEGVRQFLLQGKRKVSDLGILETEKTRILLELDVTDSTILFSFTNEIETSLINILNDPPFAASKIVFINIFIVATSIPEQEEESNIIDITFREALNAIPNVPATHESIKKLKELNEDDDDLLFSLSTDNNCTICQENLLFEDWKIVEMPCSHLFHKNCIVSWLKINHLCPLCRYSMPTSNNVAAAEN